MMRPCSKCGNEMDAGPHGRKSVCYACGRATKNASRAAWCKQHPERIKAIQAKANARFKAAHPERVSKRAGVFGVREDEFARWVEAQGGRCAICGTTEPGPKGWNLDHDHAHDPKDRAGHRGVLCRGCNLMLGNARDSEDVLLRAVEYLRAHRLRRVA